MAIWTKKSQHCCMEFFIGLDKPRPQGQKPLVTVVDNREYALPYPIEGLAPNGCVIIKYCPWCGHKLGC